MPQAADWLRDYWGGADDAPAITHLEARGFVLTPQWIWKKPRGLEMTERDWNAIQFLMDEWDYGGMVPEDVDTENL